MSSKKQTLYIHSPEKEGKKEGAFFKDISFYAFLHRLKLQKRIFELSLFGVFPETSLLYAIPWHTKVKVELFLATQHI